MANLAQLGITCEKDNEGIAVITWGGDGDLDWGTKREEHRFRPEIIDGLNQLLDQLEEDKEVKGVVFTGKGKFFSNGIDMAWIDAQSGAKREAGNNNLQGSNTLSHPLWGMGEKFLGRVLTFGLPTAAAINGHWVALGCMFGLACDYRVMKQDKGFMFVPAVEIGAVYSPGMTSLMSKKVSPNVLRDMMTFARRFNAAELKQYGVIEAAVPEDQLVSAAKDAIRPFLAKGRMKNGKLSTMGGIKRSLFKEAAENLENAGAMPSAKM